MKSILVLSSFLAAPLFAASGGDLDANDYVGVSFWLVTAAMAAATTVAFSPHSPLDACTLLTVACALCVAQVPVGWATAESVPITRDFFARRIKCVSTHAPLSACSVV